MIKGTKSGIILVLDPDIPFDELQEEIAKKFFSAKDFLGSSHMGLSIKGRVLSKEEEDIVLDIIGKNCNVKIVCIVDADDELDKVFSRYVSLSDEYLLERRKKELDEKEEYFQQLSLKQQEEMENQVKLLKEMQDQLGSGTAKIFKGNLRSGQTINCETSVIILGDVKPGASVTSTGSIIVMGSLHGSAFAGSTGDINAFVMAMSLDPLQVRIGELIAISPDAVKGKKLKIRRGIRKEPNVREPEVAFVQNGHIVKMVYGASFLRSNMFIS